MAAAAETRRASCAEHLEGSIRQLRRYIATEKPIKRVIQEKIQRVKTDLDELVASHHAYGAKAGTELSDAAMRTYIDTKSDTAYDLLDEAEVKLDEQSFREESKIERHEVDLCAEGIAKALESLREHCTKDDGVEADAYLLSLLFNPLTNERSSIPNYAIN